MSNDNKTLADVQPGGRVRLGDQAERARFEAWVSGKGIGIDRWKSGAYMSRFVQEKWEIWQAALSAQPSPGGQGDSSTDLVPGIVRCAKCQFQLARSNLNMHSGTVTAGDSKTEPCPNGCGPLWPVTWGTWAREGWAEAERLHLEKAALAARQPVGEPVGYFDPDVLAHLTEGLIDPVGVLRRKPNGKSNVPVWLAPPAQAVDLDAVRALLQRRIEQWRSHLPADPGAPGTREIETKGEHDYNNDVRIYREGIAVMEELLALIDSHSGVSRD